MLRLLAGLDTPTSGQIIDSGSVVTGTRRTTCMMFQEARLLPFQRVRDNVGLGLLPAEVTQNALSQVGLAERGNDWPHILSGGQKQRIALARALAMSPRLLLLDEPLGALDALTRREMQGLIENLWRSQGFTVVLVTHDVEEAVALADRVIVLDAERIVQETAIDLPRPRPRDTAAFIQLREILLQRLLTGGH